MPAHIQNDPNIAIERVDQTTFGIRYFERKIQASRAARDSIYRPIAQQAFSITGIPGSQPKKLFEPEWIAANTFKNAQQLKAKFLTPGQNCRYLLAGCGIVGGGILRRLLKAGETIQAYDPDPAKKIANDKVQWLIDLEQTLINNEGTTILLGCTGYDITQKFSADFLDKVKGQLIFASCSSENIEFLSLQQHMYQRISTVDEQATAPHIHYQNKAGGIIIIADEGTPISFDNIKESIAPENIDLIITAIMAGAVQAARGLQQPFHRTKQAIRMLDPEFQQWLTLAWAKNTGRQDDPNVRKFKDIEWIKEHSGGLYTSTNLLPEEALEEFVSSNSLTF